MSQRLSSSRNVIGNYVIHYPKVAEVLGSDNCAIFHEFIDTWMDSSNIRGRWVHFSVAEIHRRTGLSYEQQRLVRDKLKKLGVLEERHYKSTNKFFYRINRKVMDEVWDTFWKSHPEILAVYDGAPETEDLEPEEEPPVRPKVPKSNVGGRVIGKPKDDMGKPHEVMGKPHLPYISPNIPYISHSFSNLSSFLTQIVEKRRDFFASKISWTDADADSLFSAVRFICKIELGIAPPTVKGNIGKTARELAGIGVQPIDVLVWGVLWHELDFRGQKDEPPTPHIVRNDWNKILALAQGPQAGGGKSNVSGNRNTVATDNLAKLAELERADREANYV